VVIYLRVVYIPGIPQGGVYTGYTSQGVQWWYIPRVYNGGVYPGWYRRWVYQGGTVVGIPGWYERGTMWRILGTFYGREKDNVAHTRAILWEKLGRMRRMLGPFFGRNERYEAHTRAILWEK